MVVLIVDSSLQVINGLVNLLAETGLPMDIHKAVSHNEALALFKATEPEVLLLDRSLPETNAIDFLKDIKATNIKTTVIILSFHTGALIEEECKLHGADFFLDKYHEFEKIPEVITAIAGTNNN